MNAHDLNQPPHSVDAEQAVLGGLLLDNGAWDRIADLLTPADFYLADHRLMFETMRDMFERGEPVDVVTLAARIEARGEAQKVGLGYVATLSTQTPSAANIVRYAGIVTEKRARRDLLAAGHRIAGMASTDGGDAGDAIQEAQALVMALTEGRSAGSEPQAVDDLLPAVLRSIDERFHKAGEFSGVASGYGDLDRLTCGLQPGDLVIVAGRPSMGKTTLAVNIAENVAADGGVALVFSLEMGARQLVERSVCRFGGISTTAVRNGDMRQEDFERLLVAHKRLQGKRLVIDDTPSTSPARMRAKARKVKHRYGRLDLVVIDYLQLMAGDGNTRSEQLGGLTRALKLMARELGAPVVLLSQLNRGLEQRTDKRPVLSDLRESGAIEQDADVVLMVHRPDYYDADSPHTGLAEVLIRKQRMGPLGTVTLCFEGEFSRFHDVDHDALREAKAHAYTASNPRPTRRKGGFDD
ncbi:DnaB helicase [Thiobacillus denitrificans ATCC 25259]|uniref:Replicative DNA helicase n=1 Tax=Thiobacillus denitrificans (strain ATCC 25259 / T1) TaxID=292415 RepID=Q3SH68_THIDA|nr:replicative DNA helicase [Thiobacillus denitrificans]AAZ98021.1 DnaB helicase [Thiobacillus denitrificans ATCC 25259]